MKRLLKGGSLHSATMAAGINMDLVFDLSVPNQKYKGVTMSLCPEGVLVEKGSQKTILPYVNFKAIHLEDLAQVEKTS